MPTASIKLAKITFIHLEFSFFRTTAPIIPPKIELTVIINKVNKSILFLFIYTSELIKLIGKITHRVVAWAYFVSIFRAFSKNGTHIIPPPPPKSPFINPTSTPHKIAKRVFDLFFVVFIKILFTNNKNLFAILTWLLYTNIVNILKGEIMTTTKKFNLTKKIAFAIILALSFVFITQIPAILNKTYAQTEVQYEEVTLTNGSFSYNNPTYLTSSPNGWSLQGTSTGKNGVINISSSKFKQESFALTDNPSKGYSEYDDNILMLNANSEKGGNLRNNAGYKSNSISLDSYSYYEISLFALTQNSAKASIYVSGLDDEVNNTSYELISTTGNWVEYKFFIATGIDSETVNIELWLGSKEKESPDAVFFDEVSVKKTSGSYYYQKSVEFQEQLDALNSLSSLSASQEAQKEEYENILETINIIDLTDFESDVIENANFEKGKSTSTPVIGWTLADDFSTNVNSKVVRVDKQEDSTIEGVEYLGSSLSQNNYYSLLLYSNISTHFGYKSSSFTVKPYEAYKITVWAKLSSDFSGNAYVKLVEGDDINEFYKPLTDSGLEIKEYTPQTKSITISSNTTNKLTNDYTAYSFYVKGHELYETSLSLELLFGDTDNNATGSVAFDDITCERISWEQFSNASSTNSATLTLTNVNSPSVSNGSFNVGLDVEKNVEYPVKPANWTISQEDDSKGIYGIINTYSGFYELNKQTYGNVKNPGNQNGVSVDNDVNNVLMIYNNQETYQKITSDSISISKQTYKKLSFVYKTVKQSFETKLMNVYVLDSDNNVIYSDEGLYSDEWATYSILIKSSEYTDTIKLEISLGNEDYKVNGYLFVDDVTLEDDSTMTDEQFAEYSKSNNNIINFTITNFDLISKDTTLGMYTPFKYTQKLESGENATTGNPVAYGGIIDGENNIYGVSNSENNENTSKYMPAIRVDGNATYTLTNKDSLSLETGKYYKFTIDIYTKFSGDVDQSNVSEEDKVKYGAMFVLNGIDKSLTEIVSNDKWTTYTIYAEVSESTNVNLKFGLESGSNDIVGQAFFDNFTYSEVEEMEYTQASKNTSDKTMLVITKADTTTTDDDNNDDNNADTENNNIIWYLIPSLILFVALVIAVVAYFMKKITIKKWEKKKASEYDRNSTLYRDIIRREAEQIRDKKVKETQSEIDKIKEEIEQLEQAHKEHSKVQRTTTGNISLSQERDFKLYAKKHTALENQIEKLQGKIDNMNMPEYLLSVQRSLILEKVKKEKQAKDEALKKQKLEQKKQKMANKQDK